MLQDPLARFANFTPLNVPIDQVLMLLKDEGSLTFPGKLKGDPDKRSMDKYCRFHRDHEHDTSECYDLKQQIEALIRQGKLKRFVSKEKTDRPQEQGPQRENERPKPPIGDIRMIVGGTTTSCSTKRARKTYHRLAQNVQLTGLVSRMARMDDPVIGFMEEDAQRLHHPHDDVLVLSIRVCDSNTHRVLIDNGSFVDILYYPAFQQMRIGREQLILTDTPLVGFGETRVFPLGAVTLPGTVGDYPFANHQGCYVPGSRLLICLQCYFGPPYPQFMEGRNLYIPPNGQVPD
ncbi:uncharacterized protein LOC142616335 [Castanea sativa]|uniref:uncharacterized protein LOC142616335 n=1 Tax=Castanea sativa TaxID=21020 RepID=UPI003F649E6E